MDYKEEYQKALERAKKGLPIDEVFPELKESEDERIRNRIRLCLDECVHSDIIRDYERDECLAYLERLKDIDCLACDQHLKGYIAGRKVTEEEKQKPIDLSELIVHKEPYIAPVPIPIVADEQKPAEWGEEDKKMLQHIVSDLREFRDCETDEELISDYEDEISWLKNRFKSLRPQPRWKPSEEQMEALMRAITWLVEEGNHETSSTLADLRRELQKLM